MDYIRKIDNHTGKYDWSKMAAYGKFTCSKAKHDK
jgi:hypothetical protein